MLLVVHNKKGKPPGNNGLSLSGTYFNIEEQMRQYFS